MEYPVRGGLFWGAQHNVSALGSPIQGGQFEVPGLGCPVQSGWFGCPIQSGGFGVPHTGWLFWGGSTHVLQGTAAVLPQGQLAAGRTVGTRRAAIGTQHLAQCHCGGHPHTQCHRAPSPLPCPLCGDSQGHPSTWRGTALTCWRGLALPGGECGAHGGVTGG